MPWQFWKMRERVLLVGYSPLLSGGVVNVQNLLRANIPYLDLHVALRCYRPRWKSALFWLFSCLLFVGRVLVAPPRVVQVIVGSSGDALRTVPYILAARLRGCGVCLSFHTDAASMLGTFPSPVRRFILWTWRRATCKCYLSDRLRDEFADRPKGDCRDCCGVPAQRIDKNGTVPFAAAKATKFQTVIPNPISSAWISESILPRRARQRDLVFLGRWSSAKGIDDLLSVMRTLDLGSPVRCDIYSDHCPAENPENCACHPWLPEDEARQVLREAKLLVLPSHAEAYPLVLLEAAACGTPFVATNVGGVPDIARESGGGLLHSSGDVGAMREAIRRLLTDEHLWEECCQRGRRWVESLAVAQIVPRWHRLYAELGLKADP